VLAAVPPIVESEAGRAGVALRPEFVVGLMRTIIDAAIALEREIISS
jgi:hypothetical protein